MRLCQLLIGWLGLSPVALLLHVQESKRLKKMAEDKAVAATKRETFQWRLNVLSSFTRRADKDAAKKSEL